MEITYTVTIVNGVVVEKNDYMSEGPSALDKMRDTVEGGYINAKYARLKRQARSKVVALLNRPNDGKHTFTISI